MIKGLKGFRDLGGLRFRGFGAEGLGFGSGSC